MFVGLQNRDIETTVEPFYAAVFTSASGQVQYFAGCLLMPLSKLEEVQRGRDLTNWRHLYAMKDELGVTISNLKYRPEIWLTYISKSL